MKGMTWRRFFRELPMQMLFQWMDNAPVREANKSQRQNNRVASDINTLQNIESSRQISALFDRNKK